MVYHEYDDKPTRKRKIRNNVIIIAICVVCLTISLVVGLILHFARVLPEDRKTVVARCGGDDETDETCEAKGCAWTLWKEDGAPACTYPADYGYTMESHDETEGGHTFVLKKRQRENDEGVVYDDIYAGNVEMVKLEVQYFTEYSVRVKFSDESTARYEVPEEMLNITRPPLTNTPREYNVSWTTEPIFALNITRIKTGISIFDTSAPGFTFSAQYLELTNVLASDIVYGFGEHNHQQLKHNMSWNTWTIFTRDQAPVDQSNLYGAQTLYMNLEKDGFWANGVFLKNSNAMDIVLQPKPYPAVTYRVTGGILDFFIFLGPSPENVIQQYTEAVGRPLMPPYWSLGFQLSRWDYGSGSVVEATIDRNRKEGIPFDVQFTDIDYMYKKMDFTYDRNAYTNLTDIVEDLHQNGQRYVLILDHALGIDQTVIDEAQQNSPGYNPYDDGIANNVFILNPNGSGALVGEVWPGQAVYPDFLNPDSKTWWSKWVDFLYTTEGLEFDGIWIDMNEPSSFVPGSVDGCEKNTWNNPPFVPNVLGKGDDGRLYDKTICMDAKQSGGLMHYDVHSLYGHSMSIATYDAMKALLPDKRPFVLTRSTFAGTNKYAIHWLGDNQSKWSNMPWSIVSMLEFSMFGFSMTGADICGFWGNTTDEMCTRWMQLGAFYPYSRNHNAQGFMEQDPASLGPDAISSSKGILETRYKLLPYLYTLMHRAHAYGDTVARPLFHEFPADNKTWSIDRQFLWGAAVMISPVMEEGMVEVKAYFPKAVWYDYFTGKKVENVGQENTLSTPLHKINVHVRGGHVIPWQEPAVTTELSRTKPFGLLVALDNGKASGQLFWDDGVSYNTYEKNNYYLATFTVDGGLKKLNMTVVQSGSDMGSLVLTRIDLFGLDIKPENVYVNGNKQGNVTVDEFQDGSNAYSFENLRIPMKRSNIITWDKP